MYPLHLHLFGRDLLFYEGFYFLLAGVVGYVYGWKRFAARRPDFDRYNAILVVGLVGGVLVGKISHGLFWDVRLLLDHPWRMVRLWEGGMSIVGVACGAIASVAWYCRFRRLDFREVFMALAPALLLAQAVGRLGCFLNGDAFGLPTGSVWGVSFPRYGHDLFALTLNSAASSPAWLWCYYHGLVGLGSLATPPLHPTQLYEAVGDLALLGLLLGEQRWLRGAASPVFLYTYVAGYGLLRFGIEFLRGDRTMLLFGGPSVLQVCLLGAALAALWKLAALAWRSR